MTWNIVLESPYREMIATEIITVQLLVTRHLFKKLDERFPDE